jgi:tRNA(His) guanylyltransferase
MKKIMKDELGDRMKRYENTTRYQLPPRVYTCMRLDGKSFSSYTKGLKKPFDQDLIDDMDETAKYLCEKIPGCKLGFVQSDEISLILTDFDKITTEAWFNRNIQKMVSVSASMATSKFNQLRFKRYQDFNYKLAEFDSRIFTVGYIEEAINCILWRQQDCTRNSISTVAQSLYSHNQLNGKSSNEMQEMIFQKGINWNDLPVGQKRGRLIAPVPTMIEVKREQYEKAKDKTGFYLRDGKVFVKKSKWKVIEPPIFSQEKTLIRMLLTPQD